MNKLKKILLLAPITILLLSCNNAKGKKKSDLPGGGDTSSTVPGQQVIQDGSTQIDTNHLSLVKCAPDSVAASLPTPLRGQQGYFWCWAACAQMVMEQLGASVSQCDEANRKFERRDCCDSRTPPFDCDDAGWPEFDTFGFSADRTNSMALNWEDVKTQISCQKAPFCFTKKWLGEGNGGHMLVVSGYKTENGENHVLILDPEPVGTGHLRWITYAAYVSGPGYTHWDDFYNIIQTGN